jgi:RNA-directed DNA polymerase
MVKALQWLLTHSRSAKALAVKRVTENQGKKTAGVDGTIWSTPEAKLNAVLSLKRCDYNPSPLRRVYIAKSNGKQRPLGIPTMKDRAMQALHLLALEPIAETLADGHSYGFRPKRSTADAQEQCFTTLAKVKSPQWVLEGDIKGCFDNISHQWMLDHAKMDKVILQKWLTAVSKSWRPKQWRHSKLKDLLEKSSIFINATYLRVITYSFNAFNFFIALKIILNADYSNYPPINDSRLLLI